MMQRTRWTGRVASPQARTDVLRAFPCLHVRFRPREVRRSRLDGALDLPTLPPWIPQESDAPGRTGATHAASAVFRARPGRGVSLLDPRVP